MHVTDCQEDAAGPVQSRRMIGGALVLAGGLLLSAWLRTRGGFEGADGLALAVAGLIAAAVLNGIARVRGLPFLVAGVACAMALAGWALGASGAGLPPGAILLMTLFLSVYAKSWKEGLTFAGILGGAELIVWSL